MYEQHRGHEWEERRQAWESARMAPSMADIANAERVRPGLETLGMAPGEGDGFAGPRVSRSSWALDGGPLIYSHTLYSKNGRSVTGTGFTPEGAEEDAIQGWMRGEG